MPALKTYSKRAKRSFAEPVLKKRRKEDTPFIISPSPGSQRHALHGAQPSCVNTITVQPTHKERRKGDSPTSNPPSQGSQGQDLHEAQPSCVNTSTAKTTSKKRRTEDSSAPNPPSSVSQRHAPLEIHSNHASKTVEGNQSENGRNKDPPTAISPSAGSQRRVLHAIDRNSVRKIAEGPLSKKGRDGHNNIVDSSQVSHKKKVIKGPEIRREEELPTPVSSQQATQEAGLLKSASQRVNKNLERPSRKRRQPETVNSPSTLPAKKAKHSSITNYFKPLPSSSSPSTTRSTDIFSDNLEPTAPLSSPPSSPVSGVESPAYRKRRKRRLNTKPSLFPVVTMQYYEDECDNMSLSEVVGNMDDENRVECAEKLQDREERRDLEQCASYGTVRRTQLPTASTASTASVTTTALFHSPVHHSKPIPIPAPQQQRPRQISFRQLHFIWETTVIIECNDCGLVYNRTIKEEVADHEKWHRDYTRGNKPMKNVLGNILMQWNTMEGFVHTIQVNSHPTFLKERLWFENCLNISMNSGLDGMWPSELWSETQNPQSPNDSKLVPRFKIYVYTVGLDVASVVLAERIAEGGEYYYGPKIYDQNGRLPSPIPANPQELVSLDSTFPVFICIDRMWTHRDHRRNGYATRLIDYIRKDFIGGIQIRKDQIAFSLPTEDGRAFAAKYCQSVFQNCEFLVNVDDAMAVIQGGVLKARV